MAKSLVLASSSKVRARLLRDAGVTFDVVGSDVDEDQIKQQHADMDVETLARTLARARSLMLLLMVSPSVRQRAGSRRFCARSAARRRQGFQLSRPAP